MKLPAWSTRSSSSFIVGVAHERCPGEGHWPDEPGDDGGEWYPPYTMDEWLARFENRRLIHDDARDIKWLWGELEQSTQAAAEHAVA